MVGLIYQLLLGSFSWEEPNLMTYEMVVSGHKTSYAIDDTPHDT